MTETVRYPIYIISLKRTPERRLWIQRQLDALGLDYQFIDAIDKHDLEDAAHCGEGRRTSIHQQSDIDPAVFAYKYNTLRDHWACSLSHLKAYQLMIDNQVPGACILEDDATLSAAFPKLLVAAQKVQRDAAWDILLLAHRSETVYFTLANNPAIQKSLINSPHLDYRLFDRRRGNKGDERPFAAPTTHHLDQSLASRLEWNLLRLATLSKASNVLMRYGLRVYRYLMKLYQTPLSEKEEYTRAYTACCIGGLAIRGSQRQLYKNYHIAQPIEPPGSTVAYLLTLEAAMQWKHALNIKNSYYVDSIPWHLQNKHNMRLRIVTPPGVAGALVYSKYPTLPRF